MSIIFDNFDKNEFIMKLTPSKINTFNIFKLPAVFFMGVRVKSINNRACTVTVKHRWLNQNPFKSLFWAVQGMAAELTTGAIVMAKIQESGKKVSMLVTTNNATFTKKATGRITFVCNDGELIDSFTSLASDQGIINLPWSIPSNMEPGTYTIDVTDAFDTVQITFEIL